MIGTKRLMALALGLALLSGCNAQPSGEITPYVPPPSSGQPSNATTTPTPSPTATPTPTVTPTQTKAELLAEAEKTYRAYVVETLKLEAVGGADELPEGVAIYLEEPYLEAVRQSYANMLSSGAKLTRTDLVTIENIRPIDETEQDGAVIAFSACLDASRAIVVEADGSRRPGNKVTRTLFFKSDGAGQLRIFYSEADEVPAC